MKSVNEQKSEKVQLYAKMNPELVLQDLLLEKYDFRYNLITEQVEFKKKKSDRDTFILLDKRLLNTLCMEVREAGVKCWDKDVLQSSSSKSVAPLLYGYTD